MANYLDILADSSAEAIVFPCEHSGQFAFQLRQAFFAARHHDEFGLYHGLKDDYRVHAGIAQVTCKRVQKDGEHFRVDAAIVGQLRLEEITSLTGVFGAAIRFKNVEELWFPSCNLIPKDRLRVYEWTASRDWQYIDHLGSGMTLTKKEVDEDLLWSPEDG
jgi:hypothetical protein